MNRQELILSILSVSDSGSSVYTPVQIQKLLFLIDKNASSSIGGPFFNFIPYHYGPFDKSIYREMENLGNNGYVDVQINFNNNKKEYKLTSLGMQNGKENYNTLPENIQIYFRELNTFIMSLTFPELIATIYKAYPEMKQNSIFND